jgi:hypothetical protein
MHLRNVLLYTYITDSSQHCVGQDTQQSCTMVESSKLGAQNWVKNRKHHRPLVIEFQLSKMLLLDQALVGRRR